MSDETTPQDDAAMPPASDGSVGERPLGDQEVAVEILKLRVAELEQAIRRLAEQDATLSVVGGNVTVTMDATLTDEERDAIGIFAATAWTGLRWSEVETHAATLRGLLKRMQ